jgi:RNA polymerase sigma-70 factor, ECF subfamily
LPPNDEQLLVAGARRGDQDAMEALYKQSADKIYSLLYRLCGDAALAQDLAQDVWVRAFTKINQYRGEAAFSSWVARLARNRFIDHLRSNRRSVSFDDVAPTTPALSQPPVNVVDRIAIEDCLERLPPGYRAVLVMHLVNGLSHDEIARELGVASVTCRTQLFKARARMAECLGGRSG